jgi:multicomponent Na+:H+ antiporter subunit D
VFLGLGPREDPAIVEGPAPGEVDPELDFPHNRVPRTMTASALLLSAGALIIGLVPGIRDALLQAAERFVDRRGYAETVLHGAPSPKSEAASAFPGGFDLLLGGLTAIAAVGLAWLALAPARPRIHRAGLAAGAGIRRLHSLHTGYVADYVTWLVAGTALLGALFAVTLTT